MPIFVPDSMSVAKAISYLIEHHEFAELPDISLPSEFITAHPEGYFILKPSRTDIATLIKEKKDD